MRRPGHDRRGTIPRVNGSAGPADEVRPGATRLDDRLRERDLERALRHIVGVSCSAFFIPIPASGSRPAPVQTARRSGLAFATYRTDASPSAASPATSKPSVSSTTARATRRKGAWSSTISTRTRTAVKADLKVVLPPS
jgi:hypothetical protein